MPFVDSPRCKICTSTLRPKIDELLGRGVTHPKIIAFAAKNSLSISKLNLCRHSTKHRGLTKKEIDEKTAHFRSKEAARVHFGQRTKAIVSANKCLEDIITCAYDRMATGEVKPSIDNALKAIELQAKLKETGLLETSIIAFMLEFSREGAPHEITAMSESREIPYVEQTPEPIKGLSNAVAQVSEMPLIEEAEPDSMPQPHPEPVL